eukprot:365154-Chlamydomonas_euryale.AAC.7
MALGAERWEGAGFNRGNGVGGGERAARTCRRLARRYQGLVDGQRLRCIRAACCRAERPLSGQPL